MWIQFNDRKNNGFCFSCSLESLLLLVLHVCLCSLLHILILCLQSLGRREERKSPGERRGKCNRKKNRFLRNEKKRKQREDRGKRYNFDQTKKRIRGREEDEGSQGKDQETKTGKQREVKGSQRKRKHQDQRQEHESETVSNSCLEHTETLPGEEKEGIKITKRDENSRSKKKYYTQRYLHK